MNFRQMEIHLFFDFIPVFERSANQAGTLLQFVQLEAQKNDNIWMTVLNAIGLHLNSFHCHGTEPVDKVLF